MNKVSLLQISLDDNIGIIGSEAYQRQKMYSSVLEKNVILIFKRSSSFEEDNLLVYGAPTYIPKPVIPIFFLILVILLRRKLRFNLITTQDPLITAWFGYTISVLTGKRLMIQHHSPFIGNNLWVKEKWYNVYYEKIAIELCKRYCNRVVSPQIKFLIEKRINHDNLSIILLPVLPQLNIETEEKLLEQRITKEKNEKITVGWISRFVEFKDPKLFVDIARSIGQTSFADKLKLVMLGKGPLGKHINDLVNSELENIDFTISEQVPDIQKFYRDMDLLVHTSKYEGYGRIIPEAISNGIIPITSYVGAAFHLKNNIDSYIVFDRDVENYTSKIIQLLSNQELFENMKGEVLKTRAKILKYYQLDNYLEKVARSYENCLRG